MYLKIIINNEKIQLWGWQTLQDRIYIFNHTDYNYVNYIFINTYNS